MSKSKEQELQDAMKIRFYIWHSVRHMYCIFHFEAKKAECGNMSKIWFAEFVMFFLLQVGLYMVYLVEHLNRLQEWVFYTKKREEEWSLYEHICLQTNSFRGTALTFTWLQSSRFLSVGTRKHPSVLICNWKWTDTSPKHFNVCQTIRSDQMRPCMYWTRWVTFWAFVVNCDLINYKNLKLLSWERLL